MTTSSARTRRHILLSCLSFGGILAIVWLFLVCCWSAAADAQGAVAFFFGLPIFGVALSITFALAWSARRWRGGRIALGAVVGLAAFLTAFYVSSFVPRLGFLPRSVIHLVAEAYKGATGKTPFEADKGL